MLKYLAKLAESTELESHDFTKRLNLRLRHAISLTLANSCLKF